MVFYIDNSYFYNQIFNQIALVSTNALNIEYTYKNIDRFKSIGSNFNISTNYKGLRMLVGGSYTGIYNNAFELIGKNKYMYSPELRLQSSYTLKKGRFKTTTFSVFHKYNGRIFGYALDNLRNIVNTYSQAYHILDFTISKPMFKYKLNLTFGCKNIMNVTTINATNISSSFHNAGSNTMPVSVGRSIFLQLNYKL
jgi:outer membrane receptor for ferrienterochelin and colicins